MVRLDNNRLLILEQDGNFIEYKKQINVLHQECLESYCKTKKIDPNLQIKEVIRKTLSVIIYNISDDVIVLYLPNTLSNEQLYQLELFNDFSMNDVKILNAEIVDSSFKTFNFEDDVQMSFSNELLQSYYEKESSKKK